LRQIVGTAVTLIGSSGRLRHAFDAARTTG
jgi:hypothetical protein